MIEKKTIILIDGHSLAYRSYFALERTGMRNSNNEPTWAVFGFFKAFFDLISRMKPDAIAVSFDISKKTFRNEMFPEYKANRPPSPEAMRQQVNTIRRGIKLLNIPVYECEGCEADDVIGTLCQKIVEEGNNVRILTGDQDSFQLIDDDHVRVIYPSKGELHEYDKEKVFEKLGVYPDQLTDYKGLCGDTSDNIPGVKGIGAKGASSLLAEYKTLENLYENIDKITKAKMKSSLQEYKELAFLSKDLATIRRNLDIDFDFTDCHLEIPNLDEFVEFLKEMEFRNFLRQLPSLFQDFENFADFSFSIHGEKVKKQEKTNTNVLEPEAKQPEIQTSTAILEKVTIDEVTGQAKLAFVMPAIHTNPVQKALIINKAEDLKELVSTLNKKTVFAIDLETDSLKVLEANIVGIAISWQEKETLQYKNGILISNNEEFMCNSAYIPLGHLFENDQIPIDDAVAIIKPLLEDTKVSKVLHNAKFDMHILQNYDIKLKNVSMDTMLASYIDDPANKHGLKSLVMQKFQFPMTEYEDLAGKGKNQITLDKVEVEKVAEYANLDSSMTLKLANYYANKLDEKQQDLLYNMEIPLMLVLINMERVGIGLDTAYLKELSVQLALSLEKLEEQIYEVANYPTKFNINSPKQLGDVLFVHMGLPAKGKTKTKTGYSTSASVLESLVKEHSIAGLILEHRHLSKLKSTYIDSLPRLIDNKDHRIHTSFNQAITTTGRLSSSDPNLQNIPIRTELGNSIRKAFVPDREKNNCLVAADYSQIELRFLADLSQEPNLIEAFNNNVDVHSSTACKVFGVSLDNVTKEMRRKAKAVNFGIIYGQTAYGLSEALNITPKEAKIFIEKYFQTYPRVKEYMDSSVQEAHRKGYVVTKFGRKRFFANELSSSNRMIREFAERAAINSPLQGSAADLIKIAMINLDKKLKELKLKSRMLLQVHDELVLEVPKEELEEVKQLVKDCMEKACELSVPLVVDTCVGDNWMEAK